MKAPPTRGRGLALGLAASALFSFAASPRPATPPTPSPSAGPAPRPAPSPPARLFGAGERLTLRMTYAHLLAGRAEIAVLPAEQEGRPVLRLRLDVRSEGLFAWLFRYRVDDHTVATWDPASGCSYGIEKHLREGRAARDQVVRFDPVAGMAYVEDAKIPQHVFVVGPCALDVFSAFFVIGMALPVLPLHVHQRLGMSPFVVGLVASSQFAAALLSRLWAGRITDTHGAKRAVLMGLIAAVAGAVFYLISL